MNSVELGQRVRIPFGVGTISGKVVEDRGLLGAGGRRLYVVEVPNDPDEPDYLLRTEDDLELDTSAAIPLSDHEVSQFLERGGLLSILDRNVSRNARQPTVWLCRDSLGNVSFTYDEERGLAYGNRGGRRIPFSALRGEKIARSKSDDVVNYLTSFGLSRVESQRVVDAVGTAS